MAAKKPIDDLASDLFSLGAGWLSPSAFAAASSLTGDASPNFIVGTAEDDRLVGRGGADTLDGAAGADTMIGGIGSDDYFVDDPGDIVKELVDEGAHDFVNSRVNYALPGNVEDLKLTGGAINGIGNDDDNVITGNGQDNSLSGGDGADVLYGNGGRDTLAGGNEPLFGADIDFLYGGGGNDVIVWDSPQIDRLDGGAGRDTLKVGMLDLVTKALAGDPLPEDFETIHLTGRFGGLNINAQQLVDISSTDSLRVMGRPGNAVIATGSWIRGADTVIGGHTYAQYTQGDATLQIDVEMDRSGVGPNNIDLLQLDGADGFRVTGLAGRYDSGRRVSNVGDVNGDGFDDFAIGGGNVNASGVTILGSCFVVLGSAAGPGSNLDLSAVDGGNGFRLVTMQGLATEYSIAGLGDVNGDGLDDLAVRVATNPAGSADDGLYVVYGDSDGFSSTLDLSTLEGTTGAKLSGTDLYSLAAAGDLNGDGFDDVIVRSATQDYMVLFGGASGLESHVDASDLDGISGFRITNSSEVLGVGVAPTASVGDVNGDGVDDLLIGNYRSALGGPYSGAAYVVFGHTSAFSSELDLAALDGLNGFAMPGGGELGNALGEHVSGAGDFNGDGFADILVETPGPTYDWGITYVVFGGDSGFSSSIDLSHLDGTNGFAIVGYGSSRARPSVAAGDVNADGYDDVILADFEGYPGDKIFIVFGSAEGFEPELRLADLDGTNGFVMTDSGDGFSKWVGGGGDVNGDGFADVIIGAPNHIPDGGSYVVYGRDFTGEAGLVGTAGNDVLTGTGGAQVIKSGAGDDRIRVPDLDFFRIDGGGGTDRLVLMASDQEFDFSLLDLNAVRGIETIDLHGGGNTLRMTHLDALNLSDTSNVLTVRGTDADTVDLGADDWVFGHTGNGGFDYYKCGAATLRIDADIDVIGVT